MEIFVNVTNQKLSIASSFCNVVSGSQEFVKFKFVLGEEWNGLLTFAQFTQNGHAYNSYLDENNCAFLPSEIQGGTCTMMLYGADGTVKATTNYLTLKVENSALISDASSTDISQSLYDQLVERFNRIADLSESDYSDLIVQQVGEIMAGYLENGDIAAATIQDGSIPRTKVNSAFEATLAKADNSWQKGANAPSGTWEATYDPQGIQDDIFNYVSVANNTTKTYIDGQISNITNRSSTGTLDTTRQEIADARIFQADYTPQYNPTVVGGQFNYNTLKDSLHGVYQQSKAYADSKFRDYSPFDIRFIEQPPTSSSEAGEERTFYLVPKTDSEGNITGYDKWWYIQNADGYWVWDTFGSTSTVVTTAADLPNAGNPDTDYIVAVDGGYVYKKYINNEWVVIAGSMAKVLTTAQFEALQSGDELTDYYVPNSDGVYLHYRWINNDFELIGSDSYSKAEVDTLIQGVNNSVSSAVDTQNGRISVVEAGINGLGNLVSDITETNSGIKVYYKNGTEKNVNTKDTTVRVEDVNKSENGIMITYTDNTTKEIEISGGGSGAASGSASIVRDGNAAIQCVYGGTCQIGYTFSAIDSAGDIVGSGTATWYVNNIKKATSVAEQGSNTFDISPYLNVGSNTVKVSVSVNTGGETPTITTKTWTVNAVNMYLDWDYDDATVNRSETFAIRWTPFGNDVSKTTHIIIDGVEYTTSTTTHSGSQQSIIINKLSHGSHLVELYCTATIGASQTLITSKSVYHDMIFADSNNNTPIISVSSPTITMDRYDTVSIPIVIYTPNSLTSDAVLQVDGSEIATWQNVDRTIQYWNYTPTTPGNKVLTITSGLTTKTINVTVRNIEVNISEIAGYAFRLKASDIAGNDALRSWNSNNVTATFSNNFDWNNGGVKSETDSSGNTRQYICVKAGTSMTINYKLFANDAKIAGKNFKVIFKTANCRDYDAVWLNCLDGGIGISLGANGGSATSEQNAVSVQYAEGSYTEFEYDISRDSLRSSAGNPMRYIQTYLDGVLSSTNIYAQNDNFTQVTKKNIVIGSPDCDVYIYMIKAYETYLTKEDHITNFISDAPNATEMRARYNRNNILAQNGEIDYQSLARQNPNCRVHLWDIPRMTQNKMKKDPVAGCSYQQIYMAGDEGDQITAENVTIGVQGTSSVDYISSAANTDGNFTQGFTDGNGNHLNGYSMTENSIPNTYFNTKVNVASCENINNMCLAEWYDAHQPYVTGARANVVGGRDCMEHHIGVQFIRDRHEDNEPASAALFTDVDPSGDNYHMYAICNMGNSKNNSNIFHDTNNPLECCVETKDNNSSVCMMTTNLTMEALDSEDYFEFRYPSKPSNTIKQAFIDFVNWMCSRNPAAATGNALESSVTYEPYTFKGTSAWDSNEQPNEVLAGLTISTYAGTYTHDTYKYRMARLLSECEDHLVMDSIVYHYVFVEQHAMVDNVCKNTFWGTDDLVHWHLCKNYDNDTADGNNNTGKLTIPFGAEGMDTISGGDVFNGKMNVYWQFVYGLYPARQRMWQNREAVNTWNADAYLSFATGCQNYIPERVYNQDYWYKYLRPYEQNNDTTYIAMLEGGKKAHQREAFVRNNLTYMASQYVGTYCTSDSVTVRAYTPKVSEDMSTSEATIIGNTITAVPPVAKFYVTLYNKGYVVVKVADVIKRYKAEKGIPCEVDFEEEANDMNDTVINIHGASNIRAVADMSNLYIKFCNFSKATKLRSLQIGSNVSGYTNLGLESVGFSANPMLEELYIQNCPNATSTLDLSSCQSLRTLDVRGSGFTGIDFAVGGLVETAYLCSPASLTMRGLYYISDNTLSLESYSNLTTLRIEDTPNINSLAMVNSSVSLNRARITGIDWEIDSTAVLNRLLSIAGLDENSHGTDVSILAGDVYVSGQIRQREIDSYANAWNNLNVTFDNANKVTQYIATFKNYDGTVLYSEYLDSGTTVVTPVGSKISTPVRPQDEQYTYTFVGWTPSFGAISRNMDYTAVYDNTTRTYTIRWFSDVGGSVLETVTKTYGQEAVFSGTLPTKPGGEASYNYNIFKGWKQSTGFVKSDIDVYPDWETASLPALGTDLSTMTCAEIYGVSQAVAANPNIYIEETNGHEGYYSDKDYFDLPLGQDFDFNSIPSDAPGYVSSEVLIENKNATGIDKYTEGAFFNGGNYQDCRDLQLFTRGSDAFTLAIDYEFIDSTAANDGYDQTLVSCAVDPNSGEGFRIYRTGTGNPMLKWGDADEVKVGASTYRNMVVLRHQKGSKFLHIYVHSKTNTDGTCDSDITIARAERTTDPDTSQILTFGALRNSDGSRYLQKTAGWIHWCKIWHDDLGVDVAKRLASWTHEKVRMEYYGTRRYAIPDTGEEDRVSASFIANNPLSLLGRMNSSNTNAGGWAATQMRTFLNTRVYDALAYKWQNIIKTVEVKSSRGSGDSSSNVVVSNDKIYLLANREVGGNTGIPYSKEVLNQTAISFLPSDHTGDRLRLKFPGVILDYPKSTAHPDGMVFINESSDPTNSELTSYAAYTSDSVSSTVEITKSARPIKEGDIWLRPENSDGDTVKVGYVYMSPETIAKHSRIGHRAITSNNIQAADGGCWIRATFWWERSPCPANSVGFINIYKDGHMSNISNASYAYGVVLGFSI